MMDGNLKYFPQDASGLTKNMSRITPLAFFRTFELKDMVDLSKLITRLDAFSYCTKQFFT